MSGPIIRKYGFPNFEKIFGPRELEHGVDDKEATDPAAEKGTAPEGTAPKVAPGAPSEEKRPSS